MYTLNKNDIPEYQKKLTPGIFWFFMVNLVAYTKKMSKIFGGWKNHKKNCPTVAASPIFLSDYLSPSPRIHGIPVHGVGNPPIQGAQSA